MALRWSQEKIQLAQDLRSRGLTLSEIHLRLCDQFGKTSRSRTWQYVQDTPIMPAHQARWEQHARTSKLHALSEEKRAANLATLLLQQVALSVREHLLITTMLYWGEGSKRDFCVTNTSPFLLRTFIDSLTRVLKLPRQRFTFSLRIYEDIDREASIRFWCAALDLLPHQLITVSVVKGKKAGKLPHGMCRLRLIRGQRELKLLKAVVQKFSENSVPL